MTWRQGRCLPYGEGITFWALGEVVKAQAGILESDSPAEAEAKLNAVVPPGPDQAWMRERLLPLIGLESTAANRDESFTAWRLFLEGMAADHPAVVVIEDLHWADEAMLAFLEHVANEATHGPLFVLATTRPELLVQHPDFAADLPNAHRLELAPLTTDETASLVTSLLGAVVPADLSGPIIERADGNPLYAEEYVALLRDRDLLVETDGTVTLRAGADLPLPDSIHALLAARLDTLPADRKGLLTDAAVFGKVFWDGPLVAMGDRDPAQVATALADLAQLGFLRPSGAELDGRRARIRLLACPGPGRRLPPAAARVACHPPRGSGDLAGGEARAIASTTSPTCWPITGAPRWSCRGPPGRKIGPRQMEPKAIDFLVRAGDRARGLDAAAALVRFEAAKELAGNGSPSAAGNPRAVWRKGAGGRPAR